MIVFESTISKFKVLTPCGKVTKSQKWVKLSKLVFHLPMLVERQKSKVKENWYFEVKYSFMKPLSQNFEVLTNSTWVTSSTQNWLQKGPKLVSHVLMLIERSKSKIKGTPKYNIRS